ncbi:MULTISPECIES: DUF1240 domain-containing protein [Photorhabdus]|uniref:Membrane protein n=2 Tax=Photorhabdus asymbiotica TaxID=291112 RepID=B6VMC2_PHOAA|nr:DUF1240 domain-containing protein [Photorhabdus asymbiotica]RKS54430.1 uncharacterized protein DUF1240 [Photorhabdus asymbiotica]CAQ82414.1 putative membrane protein precursor [Photorhabdus asymbiotica]CAR67302.1 putative membrane protein precursor [Photorhabdus asymbiotica subsp. asymbiotica ATCC 43949]
MGNKRKVIHIICALFIFILTSFTFFLTGGNLNSLIKMDEKIIFSSGVFMIFFSSPLVFYYVIFVIFVNITGRYPKHHDGFNKYLGTIAIISFFLGFPTSLYVNYKLKSDGYLVCPRISWMSPNTYVKDIKLCD